MAFMNSDYSQKLKHQSEKTEAYIGTMFGFVGKIKIDSENQQQKIQSQFFWSKEQIKKLEQMYFTHGSSWKLIKINFPNKSQQNLKNRVNNAIRKVAFRISQLNKSPKKENIWQLILTLLKLCFQVQEHVKRLNRVFNSQSMFFKLKSSAIRLIFKQELSDNELQDLLNLVKHMNKKLKCFGVFKVRNLKNWSLSQTCFKAILNIDKPYLEEKCEKQEEKEENMTVQDNQRRLNMDSSSQSSWEGAFDQTYKVDLTSFYLEKSSSPEQMPPSENLQLQFCSITQNEYNPSYALFSGVLNTF